MLGLLVVLLMYGNALITPFFEEIAVDKLTIVDHLFIKYTLNSIVGSLYALLLSAIVVFQFDASKAKLHQVMSIFAFIFSLGFLLNIWRLFALSFS